MPATPVSRMRSTVAIFLIVSTAACGSSSYLIDAAYLQQPQSRGIPAQAEPTGQPVFVNPEKMRLDQPAAVAVPPPQLLFRVKPRRPRGLLIGGGITFGLGVVLMVAGGADLYCPAGALCEQGVAVASLLGVGSALALFGGIPLLVAAGKWSPEVKQPYSY